MKKNVIIGLLVLLLLGAANIVSDARGRLNQVNNQKNHLQACWDRSDALNKQSLALYHDFINYLGTGYQIEDYPEAVKNDEVARYNKAVKDYETDCGRSNPPFPVTMT